VGFNRSKRERRAPKKSAALKAIARPPVEEAIQNVRVEIERYVAAWIHELEATGVALQDGITVRSREVFLETGSRLERLGKALRLAPEGLEQQLRKHLVPLASSLTAFEDIIHDHEVTERKLAVAHAELRRRVAERNRLEDERRKAEQGLREVQARFESAFANAAIGMALVDMDGRWLQVNDSLCRITGLTAEELKATTLEAMTHPEDIDLDQDSRRELLDGRITNFQIEKRYRHAWGHYFWALLTVSLVRDAEGRVLHLVSQVQDISERKNLAQRLEYLIDHDFLTGLFNRRRFELELSREVERVSRYQAPAAVLELDLDNFKDVNDAFGHKAGDDLLKGVAGALKHRIRQSDLLARVGGDEFAVLLPETDADQAQIVADGIVKALSRHVAVLGDKSIRITASVGLALFDGLSAAEVLASADQAMYEAKEAGRNRFALYRPGGGRRARVSARLADSERLRTAIEENQFILYGQPILDLGKNEVCQYEVLLRLRDEESEEPLPPSTFLYVAERFGLIQAIDSWVAQKAIALIAEHERAGRRLILHINLSGKSICDPKVAALMEGALDEAGIDPARLVVELTETAAISNIEEAKAFAHRLRARGCQLAMDDFGAGFGSFYYLKTLPFDYFKIDGAFIRGLAESPMDQLVVQAIVDIARGMGKKTIAEFVTDAETVLLIQRTGVNFAQGYHIGRPRPLLDVLPPVRRADREDGKSLSGERRK
jgi:diguanylate cyclase (GGDEF)-like protein/PAS domain S-box-containing protein